MRPIRPQVPSARSWLGICLAVAGVALIGDGHVTALIGETPTIRKVAFGSHAAAGNVVRMAFLEDIDAGNILQVRTVDPITGLRLGDDLTLNLDQLMEEEGLVDAQQPDPPTDLLFSTVFRPGKILVLTSRGRILEFSLAYDADGSPKVALPPVVDQRFAEGIDDSYLALAEAPNPADPKNPFVAAGGGAGIVRCSNDTNENGLVVIASGPIRDLEAVPQVGYFAVVAASGGRLTGINPDSDASAPELQPAVTFDLTQQKDASIEILSFTTGAVFEPNSEPLLTETGMPVQIADGTSNTFTASIVPGPQLGDELAIETIERALTNVSQVGFLTDGTPTRLAADGSAIYTDKYGFAQLTLAGATGLWLPRTFNFEAGGKFARVIIEVENGGAGDDTFELEFRLGDTAISPIEPPAVGDADADGNPDLTVRFDRAVVASLLESTNASEVLMETVAYIEQQPLWHASSTIRLNK